MLSAVVSATVPLSLLLARGQNVASWFYIPQKNTELKCYQWPKGSAAAKAIKAKALEILPRSLKRRVHWHPALRCFQWENAMTSIQRNCSVWWARFVFTRVKPLHLYTKRLKNHNKACNRLHTCFVLILTLTSQLPSEKKKPKNPKDVSEVVVCH